MCRPVSLFDGHGQCWTQAAQGTPARPQVEAQPSIPSLRLMFLLGCLGITSMFCFYTIPTWVRDQIVARQRRRQKQGAGLPVHAAPGCSEGSTGGTSDGAGSTKEGGSHVEDASPASAVPPAPQPQLQQEQAAARLQIARAQTTVRPDLPLKRGLSSRIEAQYVQRPRLVRTLALLALGICAASTGTLQVPALEYVDASVGEQGGLSAGSAAHSAAKARDSNVLVGGRAGS